MNIVDAIALCKANGYTVTKAKAKKSRSMTVGPTFVAKWSDGNVTRMSIHTLDEKPDVKRAVRVSLAAYESRTKRLGLARLEAGHFERAGTVLHKYEGKALQAYLAA